MNLLVCSRISPDEVLQQLNSTYKYEELFLLLVFVNFEPQIDVHDHYSMENNQQEEQN